jgi:hypothetical protein
VVAVLVEHAVSRWFLAADLDAPAHSAGHGEQPGLRAARPRTAGGSGKVFTLKGGRSRPLWTARTVAA